MPIHGAGSGVVGSQCFFYISIVSVDQLGEILDASFQVLHGVKGIVHAQVARRSRHELHQSQSTFRRYSVRVAAGFSHDDAAHKVRIYGISLCQPIARLAETFLMVAADGFLGRGNVLLGFPLSFGKCAIAPFVLGPFTLRRKPRFYLLYPRHNPAEGRQIGLHGLPSIAFLLCKKREMATSSRLFCSCESSSLTWSSSMRDTSLFHRRASLCRSIKRSSNAAISF